MAAQLPAKYLAARRALAEAHSIDEVKDLRDKAVGMEAYALQARDGELIRFAAEIRKRAERRIGELIEEEGKAGKLAKGGGDKRSKHRVAEKPGDPPSLAKRGIDKNLADRARKMWALAEAKFEAACAKAVKIAVAAVENNAAVITAARAERHEKKREQRQKREQALTDKLLALPDKKYGVILADPEWRFEVWSEKGKDSSTADNHYTTSPLETIKQRDVASIAADDCVLFLWATAPMIEAALEVMRAWGFTYKSQVAWDKEVPGTGYWFRNQHELLLVGTRGNLPAPAEGDQWPSVIRERRTKHSAKPQKSYELIEAYFPTLPKIELNRRGAARPGWSAWGAEAEQAA